MIQKFSPGIIDKYPEAFELISQSYFKNKVTYVLNWKYRISTELSPWLKNQIDNPTPSVLAFVSEIPDGENYDETMLNILKHIRQKLIYKGDISNWRVEEYWATADETLTGTSVYDGVTYGPLEGDCEDGAILAFVCARLKGVPANRLMIMAGSVVGGGHCWLAYRPQEYPLNWVFLDWCYWPTNKDTNNRNIYYVNGQKVFGWVRENEEMRGIDTNYQSIWFGFNENQSHYRLDFFLGYRDLA